MKRTPVILLCNMRHDKEKAFILRREGKTYREIEKLLGMSRSTLCDWFKDEEWSRHIKKTNNAKSTKLSIERLGTMNSARAVMYKNKYLEFEREARVEYTIYKNNPLFAAGLMLYAGEGDKASKGLIRFSNTDFSLHKVFLKFVEVFLKIPRNKIKISILLYPDLNTDECKTRWSKELNIPFINFYKPQVIQGRSVAKRLHFGVGSTIISNSFLKKKLFTWIEMSKVDLSH